MDVLGVREAQKLATRRRVLDAARDLFEEAGYEEATIRAIARRAKVSVGSVFTTFTSKADILAQVMIDRLDGLYEELGRVMPHLRGSTADRCRSFFAVHYAFETRRSRLFISYVAASFTWRADVARARFGANPVLRDMIRGLLVGGIARHDVRPDLDLDLVVDTLVAAYGWNFRLAVEGAAADEMIAAMDRQIGLIFDGLTPRAP